MEVTFNEPSDSGFNTILDEFFSSLQELAKDPASEAIRTLVSERGVTVAKYFNSLATHFEKLQIDVNDRIETKVSEINSIGAQIQQLNRQIYSAELDGNTANDLRDQRTLLVDKLSKIINVDASEVVVGKLLNGKEDKRFVITISGKSFIDHFSLSKLAVTQRSSKLNPDEDVTNLYDVGWEDGNKLVIRGGELKGYIDVRDGNEGENGSPVYAGIPTYIKKLNQFVQTFARAFNEGYIDYDNDGVLEDGTGHADGYGKGGTTTGVRFFTMLGEENKAVSSTDFIDGETTIAGIADMYSKITAKNFSVSKDILDDFNKIATSDTIGEVGNIVNINKLIELRTNTQMFAEGAPEDFMKSVITSLGIDSQQAIRISANQAAIVKQIENRKLSDSGVSIDEEMANLIKHQQAYGAAAQMVNAMAEIYDILINRVGV
ncbi:MAG: Flagellar hook-associated protein 1 [Firmicutes bacterium ADurb.Bin419]|nr:MAG: Flagellar hook-associated protein 1 [Firmicutes bacterium ADurb.Bin419]